jgi:hypothetical protein
VLKKKVINPFVITPILQYSNTPKLIEIGSYHDGLPSFGYRSVIILSLKPGPLGLDSLLKGNCSMSGGSCPLSAFFMRNKI